MSSISPLGNPQAPSSQHHRRGLAGLALVVIGALTLVDTLTQADLLGLLFLPALGLLFLTWGVLSRQVGPMVPGGVLLGVGVGVLLTRDALVQSNGKEHAAILLLCIGLGFALTTLLSLVFTARRPWWPLLPAGLLVLLSLAFFLGGTPLELARIIGKFWPLLLVGVGLYLLWEWYRQGRQA